MEVRQRRVQGNATVEVIVALLAVSPFLVGIPLLGKQLDVKHKAYDAARYSAWERTVWSNVGTTHRKTDDDIYMESRDRVLGDPRSGLIPAAALREQGTGENALWRDGKNRRMLSYENGAVATRLVLDDARSPIDVGYSFAPGVAYGGGPVERVAEALRVRNLGLNRHGFANASIAIGLRPLLRRVAQRRVALGERPETREEDRPVQRATAAILSDTWSARDENTLRRRVDEVTTNELIEELERPGRLMGMQARGKGEPLYGEGQYGWDPDLRPSSTTLPAAYIRRR